VPPFVTTGRPGDIFSRALKDKDMLDKRAFLEGRVDDCFGGDGLAPTLSLVSSDDNTTFAVQYTIAERFGGETCKDD